MSMSALTSTLEDFVDSKTSSSISYQTFSLVEMLDYDANIQIEFPAYSVINDYYDELKRLSVTIELTEEQYRMYRFRPKLLAEINIIIHNSYAKRISISKRLRFAASKTYI